MKMTDLLATMGGFIKALLIVGFILANPVSKLSLKTELINRLFNFEGIDEQGDDAENNNHQQQQNQQQQDEQYVMSKGFSKIEATTENQYQNDKTDIPSNQITLNFLRNNSLRNNTQYMSKNPFNKEGPPVTYTESLNSTAAHPIIVTHPVSTTFQNNTQQIGRLPILQKNGSQPRFNQLNLLKIAKRKNQSMSDLSTMGIPQLQSKKSISPLVSQQNQHQIQKDKVKLVRTMLRSFARQHSMKPEDCMKASTILGAHKKEDPDKVFKKLFKSNEKTLTMKLWDYLKYFLGLKKEVKNKQIKFSMRKVNERLDIVFIMKKLIEVDKMKMLFLNENQRKIFEYLPRPIVRLDPEKQQTETENYTLNQAWARQMFFNDKNYISKASDAMIAYQEIIQKGKTIDPLDQKLIDMLDESKKQFFQIESPIQSPNGRNKRNSLSVIKSINPQKDNNNIVIGLQNISPAESIELNEQDLQEIGNSNKKNNQSIEIINTQFNTTKNNINNITNQDDQHVDCIINKYDNTRRFNRKNTMHFMKQKTLQIHELPSLQTYSDDFQPLQYNQYLEKSNKIQSFKNQKFDSILDSLSQQIKSNNNNNNNNKQSQQMNQQNYKQNGQIYISEKNQIIEQSETTPHQITSNQQTPFVSESKIQNQFSNKKININSIQQDQIPQLPIIINDEFKDVNVPKNTINTPKYQLFQQDQSPQIQQFISPFQYHKKENSDENLNDIDSFDIEINNDYNKCLSPADEKVQQQNLKSTYIHSNNCHNHNNNLQRQSLYEYPEDIEKGQNNNNNIQYFNVPLMKRESDGQFNQDNNNYNNNHQIFQQDLFNQNMEFQQNIHGQFNSSDYENQYHNENHQINQLIQLQQQKLIDESNNKNNNNNIVPQIPQNINENNKISRNNLFKEINKINNQSNQKFDDPFKENSPYSFLNGVYIKTEFHPRSENKSTSMKKI